MSESCILINESIAGGLALCMNQSCNTCYCMAFKNSGFSLNDSQSKKEFRKLTPRRNSNRLRVLLGMNSAVTNASLPSLWSCCFSTTLESTTSKANPPAVLPLGFAKRPSSLRDSRILASSAFDFWYPDIQIIIYKNSLILWFDFFAYLKVFLCMRDL